MSVRVEKNKGVWTIIHARPESRNAMDPKSADHLTDAFLAVSYTHLTLPTSYAV